MKRFLNGELHLTLNQEVKDKTCLLLGSVAPEENLKSYLVLSDTLKKWGAKRCVAILPYLAYTRHDQEKKYQSHITSLLGKLLIAAGIDEVITIDIHSCVAESNLSIPITSLSPALLFAKALQKYGFIPDFFVAPDSGAVKRTLALRDAMKSKNEVICMSKIRGEAKILHQKHEYRIYGKVVIVDDILDTGETLISCIESLPLAEIEEIIVLVTHGLFTTDRWKKLKDLKVSQIFFLDTIPRTPQWVQENKITMLSIVPILEEFFKKSEKIYTCPALK